MPDQPAELRSQPPAGPDWQWVFTMKIRFDLELAHGTAAGQRGFRRVGSGTVEGPALCGRLATQAGDWPLLRGDGVMESDARLVIEAADGQHIYMRSRGFLLADEPSAVSSKNSAHGNFKCTAQFDTSVGQHQWLTRAVFVGTGRMTADEAVIDIFELA